MDHRRVPVDLIFEVIGEYILDILSFLYLVQ